MTNLENHYKDYTQMGKIFSVNKIQTKKKHRSPKVSISEWDKE